MQLTAHFADLADVKADWLIVGLWEEEPLSGAVAKLDTRLGGLLSRVRESGDLTGKTNEITPFLDRKEIAAARLLVVGFGKKAKFERPVLAGAAAAAARAITSKKYGTLAFAVPEDVPSVSQEDASALSGVGLMQGCLGPGLFKNKADRFAPKVIVLVASSNAPKEEIERGVRRADVEGRAVALARELVNMPPCEKDPATLAERARQVAATAGLECTVFDERRLEEEKMGSLLAVARGSEKPPRLVVLRHTKGVGKTLALVGKGVTFDSGGLSLKTTEQMVDMKCDMAGAAAVLGAMQAIAELRLPVNVLGILAIVENLPSGKAMKLGDVLRARNGKTIEVLNTDAEGRLILADALSYAVDQKVDHIVDLATLTGACMVALGTEVTGLMSNQDDWTRQVQTAASAAGERVWQLPMFPLYREMIKSDVADIKNTGGSRYAGAISAAKFLEEFVGSTPWVHLDIAGPSFAEKESATRDSGGTGCMVRTLVELARRYPTM